MYEDPTIVDLVKDKSGAELFKELYRLLPSLSFEDYFKNGVWQNDLMRLDIEVIDAHRREAGAPDPPAMEDVEFPPLPGNSQATSLGGLIRALVPGTTSGIVVPPGGSPVAAMARAAAGMQAAALVDGAEAIAPAEVKASAPMVPGPSATPMAKTAAPTPPVAPPLDMKVIALFVSKWKLDPSRAKTALEKLTPSRSAPMKMLAILNIFGSPIQLYILQEAPRAVRKLQGPKIWAFGCDVLEGNGTLHRCCVEKEICMRTCGMPWKKCGKQFEKCAEKACDMDEGCIAVAEEADVLITGGESHFGVCKAHREALQLLCDCVSPKEAVTTAELRLTDFYSSYHPERLVEGKVKDIEEVWKKWQKREPELFFELARKYADQATTPWNSIICYALNVPQMRGVVGRPHRGRTACAP
ncbi:unnamed protein product [Durusdinium trenchii]|uniref:Uncharacterized protein n=1 Tax=Durusdinium trenchii TaxID=1381693 RepID=A0ABP0PF46_9DINO